MEQTSLRSLFQAVSPQLVEVDALFRKELISSVAGVNSLVKHLGRFRGKMLRPSLVLLSGKACGELEWAHTVVATVVEMVHMATLVHDDVLDEAELRRKGATINHLRGNEAAVLLGDYLISHSFHLCSGLASQYASRLIGRTTNEVCEGELLQLENRGNLDLTEDTYNQIIARKTAALTAVSSELGAHLAGASDAQVAAFRDYGLCLGMAFQIQDDILDIVGDSQTVGKTLGIDVEKGKLTLPVIHFLRTAPSEHRQLLRSLLSGAEPDRAEKVRNLILPSGSVDYARARAESLISRSVEALAVVPPSESRLALQTMARFALDRPI